MTPDSPPMSIRSAPSASSARASATRASSVCGQAAVGERVRRGVDDAHQQRPAAERQLTAAGRQGALRRAHDPEAAPATGSAGTSRRRPRAVAGRCLEHRRVGLAAAAAVAQVVDQPVVVGGRRLPRRPGDARSCAARARARRTRAAARRLPRSAVRRSRRARASSSGTASACTPVTPRERVVAQAQQLAQRQRLALGQRQPAGGGRELTGDRLREAGRDRRAASSIAGPGAGRRGGRGLARRAPALADRHGGGAKHRRAVAVGARARLSSAARAAGPSPSIRAQNRARSSIAHGRAYAVGSRTALSSRGRSRPRCPSAPASSAKRATSASTRAAPQPSTGAIASATRAGTGGAGAGQLPRRPAAPGGCGAAGRRRRVRACSWRAANGASASRSGRPSTIGAASSGVRRRCASTLRPRGRSVRPASA